MISIDSYLREYLRNRPFFLSLLRAKEAYLYQQNFPLKKPILDVGCGDGFFARVAIFKDPSISSVDVGLDVAESRISETTLSDTYKKIVTYNGVVMPFKDSAFSTVLCNSVLEHVADLESVVSQMYRVLKKGGIALVPVMAKPWEDYLIGATLLGSFYKNWMRKKQIHLNLLTRNEWDHVFKKAGFKIAKVTGHLTPSVSAWMDIGHYLSLPSLISYTLVGKWVLFPTLVEMITPIGYFSRLLEKNVDPDKAASLFYVLTK